MTVIHTPATALQPTLRSNSTKKRAVQQETAYAQLPADEVDVCEWPTGDLSSKLLITPEITFQESNIARAWLDTNNPRNKNSTKSSGGDGSVHKTNNHRPYNKSSAKRILEQHDLSFSSPYQRKRLHRRYCCETEAAEIVVASECLTGNCDNEPKSCDIHFNNDGPEILQQGTAAVQSPQNYEKDDNVNKVEPMAYAPVIQELKNAIDSNSWRDIVQEAINDAQNHNIPELAFIRTVDSYLSYLNSLLHWRPTEDLTGRDIVYRLCIFYFILNQPSLSALQTPIAPSSTREPLSWLSAWLLRYAQAMGTFLDSPDSISPATIETFKKCKSYNMHHYIEPHGGWRTFNQFFARNFKPGYRPIAAIDDPSIIVSPADCTFAGQWPIAPDSTVVLKTIPWKISELLQDSAYSAAFAGGIFTHAFLGPNDYHRQHAPVAGTVLEAKVIPGQVYMEVVAAPSSPSPSAPASPSPTSRLSVHRPHFALPNTAGYQFVQARGLVVLDSAVGLVAILPVGMAQVSSVVLTAEVGRTLRKGEEVSYFQFGGSDCVLVFQRGVRVRAEVGRHYWMGERIGEGGGEE